MKPRSGRIEPAEYFALPLEAHDFLADAPLHDAWRMHLGGAGPDTHAGDVLRSFMELESSGVNLPVKALFALRGALGRLFGWDDEPRPSLHEASYVRRLSAEERDRSREEPGSSHGAVTVVYSFQHEAVAEVINRTVHAFLCFALVPADEGSTLFWGIYVKPVNRLTPKYMALIDPCRRWIVYPALIRRVESLWAVARQAPDGGPRADPA